MQMLLQSEGLLIIVGCADWLYKLPEGVQAAVSWSRAASRREPIERTALGRDMR